jgi:hypothetical protein
MTSLAEALKAGVDHRKAVGKRQALAARLVLIGTGMGCGWGSLQALTGWGQRPDRPGDEPGAVQAGQRAATGHSSVRCSSGLWPVSSGR